MMMSLQKTGKEISEESFAVTKTCSYDEYSC